MLRQVSAPTLAPSNSINRPGVRHTDQAVGKKLAAVAYVLWPKKTAWELALRARCEVRSAERYLAGDRPWSGDAVAAVIAEILRRDP